MCIYGCVCVCVFGWRIPFIIRLLTVNICAFFYVLVRRRVYMPSLYNIHAHVVAAGSTVYIYIYKLINVCEAFTWLCIRRIFVGRKVVRTIHTPIGSRIYICFCTQCVCVYNIMCWTFFRVSFSRSTTSIWRRVRVQAYMYMGENAGLWPCPRVDIPLGDADKFFLFFFPLVTTVEQ